jgi:hypothetical protein
MLDLKEHAPISLISLWRMLHDFYPRSRIVEKLTRLCCARSPHVDRCALCLPGH